MNIRDLINNIVNPQNADPCVMMDATVKSVDMDSRTCTVTVVFGGTPSDIEGVELVNEVEDGFLVVPSVDSTVKIVASSKVTPFVAQYSQIDRVWIVIGDTQVDVTGTGIAAQVGDDVKVIATQQDVTATVGDQQVKLENGQTTMNDGAFDGLVKVQELTQKLNTLESDLNTLKSAFNAWVPAPNDGGAALKTAATTWAGQTLTPTQQTDIENQNITHGASI